MKKLTQKLIACFMATLLLCMPVLTGCDKPEDEPKNTVGEDSKETADVMTEEKTEATTEEKTEQGNTKKTLMDWNSPLTATELVMLAVSVNVRIRTS